MTLKELMTIINDKQELVIKEGKETLRTANALYFKMNEVPFIDAKVTKLNPIFSKGVIEIMIKR